MTLRAVGTKIEHNHANEGGASIFIVSNNRSGHLIIEDAVLGGKPGDRFGTPGFSGIIHLGHGPIQVTNSTIVWRARWPKPSAGFVCRRLNRLASRPAGRPSS